MKERHLFIPVRIRLSYTDTSYLVNINNINCSNYSTNRAITRNTSWTFSLKSNDKRRLQTNLLIKRIIKYCITPISNLSSTAIRRHTELVFMFEPEFLLHRFLGLSLCRGALLVLDQADSDLYERWGYSMGLYSVHILSIERFLSLTHMHGRPTYKASNLPPKTYVRMSYVGVYAVIA